MFGYGTLGIGIAVNLYNNFSKQANEIQNSMRMLKKTTEQAMKDNVTLLRNTSLVATAIGVGLIRGMKNAVDKGMEFENTLNSIGAISRATTSELAKLKVQAMQLSEAFPYDANDILTGAKEWIKAGATVAQTLEANKHIVEMAAAAEVPLGGQYGVYEGIITIMDQFQLGADKAGQVVDVLTNTLNATKADWFDMLEGFKFSGSLFKNLNMDLSDASALLGTLNQFGVNASTAGTWMANILHYLPKALGPFATKQQIWALKQLNMGVGDFVYTTGKMKGQFRPGLDWMVPMMKALSKYDQITRENIMFGLFGMRGSKAQTLLLQSLSKMEMGSTLPELIASNRKAIQGSGVTAEIAAKKNESLKNQTQMLTDAWNNLKVTFTDAVTPALISLVSVLKPIVTALREIGSTTVGKWFMVAAAGAIVFATALAAVAAALSSIALLTWGMKGGLGGIIGGLGKGLSTTIAALGGGSILGSFLKGRVASAGIKYTSKGMPYVIGPGGGARFISKSSVPGAMGKGSIFANLLGAGSKMGGGTSAGYGYMGGMANIRGLWANQNLLGKLGLLGTAAGAGYDLYQGNYGGGIGTILGGLLGTMIAPGMGTYIGAGLGGWIGNQFNRRPVDAETYSPGQEAPYSPYATSPYGASGDTATRQAILNLLTKNKETVVNIYFDSTKVMQKKIQEGMSDDIYSEMGM